MAVVLYTEYGETDSVHVRALATLEVPRSFPDASHLPPHPHVISAGGLAEIARRQKEAAVRSTAGRQRCRRQGHGKEGQIAGASAADRARAVSPSLARKSHPLFCSCSARIVEGTRGAKTKGGQAESQGSQGGAGDGVLQEQMEELCQQGTTGPPSQRGGGSQGLIYMLIYRCPLPPVVQEARRHGLGEKGL